ncbi:MAG: DASS family sodium-coupled anion symporter [Longimicrobiales bacterium]|nr:DASS family sodium-coupled anion symporter [Longimicrobiales bacterium]
MADTPAGKPSGYDKYVNYKTLSIAVALFALLLVMPVPSSMRDVAVEYSAGEGEVLDLLSQELFGRPFNEVEQWQALTARILEKNMRRGTLTRPAVERQSQRQVERMGLTVDPEHFRLHQEYVGSMGDQEFLDLMTRAFTLRNQDLAYGGLSEGQRAKADLSTWHLKVAVAMAAFVVTCFLTEAIPLPGVAFCIGLILVFTGVVTREEVAQLFWSDACWFIMGSLMFAVAFVKTGVDKRICLILFRKLSKPSLAWITAILIVVIAPAAGFISDHALAAMFLPIAIALYNNSLSDSIPRDPELAKMLVIGIAMACNIGGFGSPSGGARNVIMLTYMEDMFGLSVGYGEWIIYAFPFVLVMMPVLWVLLNLRFKPRIRDLSPALETLKRDIARMGPWNRNQIVAVAIFLVMLLGWITESNLLLRLTGIRLGIGVLAVAGAVAYLLFGVVNWRDYQTKVDWGVVWLYAGAIIFGKVLDQTGAAYWMARSVVEGMASLGLSGGQALLAVGGAVTAGMTNLMADGPAAAAVGPITLNMAEISGAGTTLVPYMGLITSAASSMAYLLVIGTPPNAIVYASGFLEPKDFLRIGIPCFILAFLVLMFISMVYWPLLGFQGMPAY